MASATGTTSLPTVAVLSHSLKETVDLTAVIKAAAVATSLAHKVPDEIKRSRDVEEGGGAGLSS